MWIETVEDPDAYCDLSSASRVYVEGSDSTWNVKALNPAGASVLFTESTQAEAEAKAKKVIHSLGVL